MRMDLPVDEEAALDAPSDEDLAACETFASTCHPDCIACRPRSLRGLGLVFRLAPDGSAIARFPCDPGFQGYPDRLHGGIIATLLDAAMTHRLFASKIRAYTARMDLRYLEPVELEEEVSVRAQLTKAKPPWFFLRADLSQGGRTRVTAEAVFRADPAD